MHRLLRFSVWMIFGAAAGAAAQQGLDAKAEKARAALAEERFEEAARLYADLVKANPQSLAWRLALAVAEQGCGRHAQAAADLRLVLQRDPKFPGAWRLLAENLDRLGETAKAAEAYEHALKLEPSRMDLQLDAAAAYRKAGRYREAADLFLQVARADPGEARAWHGFALSYLGLARRLYASLPRESHWRQSIAKPQETPAGCESESLPCRFARGEFWQILDAAQNDRSPEAAYWQIRACLALARRAFEQLADLPAVPETRPLFREAEALYSESDLTLLEKP